MQEPDQHVSPIKNWKQLVVVVVLAFVVPIALAILVSQLVTGRETGRDVDDSVVLSRIKAVGELRLASASGPKAPQTGEQVYNALCKTCHEAGLAGAPKVGDKAAWAPRIAQGEKLLFEHAIKGFTGKAGVMPAKGGGADLDDGDVQRAVVHMANLSGGSLKAPAAPSAQATIAAAPTPPAALPAPVSNERTGEQVVAAACGKCHVTGQGGAPKIGDRAAWTSRAKLGYDRVLQSALKGHSGMPARGGLADLSDTEIKRAVEYMMNSGAATAIAPAAPSVAAAAPAADGKKVYDTTCSVCHGTGVAGAPKLGDKAAWAPRLKGGVDALVASAIKGKNAMPPRGGNAALSDAEVRAAVDYMAAAAK